MFLFLFNVKKLQLIQSWIFVTRFCYITFPYYYSVFLWFVFPSLLAKSSTYLCLFTVIAWLTLENKTPWQPIFVLNFLKVNQLQQRKHLSVNICVALTEKEIIWGALVGFNKYKILRIFDVRFYSRLCDNSFELHHLLWTFTNPFVKTSCHIPPQIIHVNNKITFW